MKSNTIFYQLEAVADCPGKKDKVSLLRSHLQDVDFLRVAVYAYDPFRTFGLATRPQMVSVGLGEFTTDTWSLLDGMSNRTITGSAAVKALTSELQRLSPESGELLWRIVNKDLRAGFGPATINSVRPGEIAEFPYMRCTLPEKSNMASWRWSDGIYSQLKADGSFANVNKDHAGQVWITTRQGTMYPDNVLGIEQEIRHHLDPGLQTHGELTVYEGGKLLPRQVGNGILNSLAQGGVLAPNQHVVFDAWDQIPLVAVVPKGSYSKPYVRRYEELAGQVFMAEQLQVVETRIVHSKAEAYGHYREMLAQGLEGTVCKHPGMVWYDTGSSGNKDQVKLKLQADFELRITGFKEGAPGTKTAATFGSLLCHSEDRTLEVGVSGLTDELRAKIHNNRDYWLDQIITVRGNGIMTPDKDHDTHSIFLPRFVEHRQDKTSADTLEQIRDQFKAAMESV